jgi:hypothetical protein
MGVQEFRSSGVQEFRSSGVQEFRVARSTKLQEKGGSSDPNIDEPSTVCRGLLNSLNS